MRKGSIALISQITTISKMRIMDPIKETSVLTGISLPKQTMEKFTINLFPSFLEKTSGNHINIFDNKKNISIMKILRRIRPPYN